MKKIIILIITCLLAITSLTCYFIVDEKIVVGEKKLAAGQKQYDEGQKILKSGKAKLSAGKQKLSRTKTVFKSASIFSEAIVKQVPVAAVMFNQADKKIREGDKQVASGEQKIRAGEKKLAIGKMQLTQGREQLAQAKKLRLALGICAAFFILLSIVIGFV